MLPEGNFHYSSDCKEPPVSIPIQNGNEGAWVFMPKKRMESYQGTISKSKSSSYWKDTEPILLYVFRFQHCWSLSVVLGDFIHLFYKHLHVTVIVWIVKMGLLRSTCKTHREHPRRILLGTFISDLGYVVPLKKTNLPCDLFLRWEI